MRSAAHEPVEWVDGFLFVANRPILDFLNTQPVLEQGSMELLPDVSALERWLIASGLVTSPKTKSLVHGWHNLPGAASFLKDLIAYRERLRDAVLRMETGSTPSGDFIREVNTGLLQHPLTSTLRKREGRIMREQLTDLQRPSDLWAFIFDATADLLSAPETHRLRRCEACVVHFFDTSKKGSRRWCSMNICGNKFKVAAYQRRKRKSEPRR
jgi:predicted RNA-binding Zn ribbon-like protein